MSVNADGNRLTALHQAAHVVLQELLFHTPEQYAVQIVEIEGITRGRVVPPSTGWLPRATIKDKESEIQKALGGFAAESIETGIDWRNCSDNPEIIADDIKAACSLFALLSFVPGKGGTAEEMRSCFASYRKDLESYYQAAKALIRANWNLVERVARELLERKQLTADEVRRLITEHL